MPDVMTENPVLDQALNPAPSREAGHDTIDAAIEAAQQDAHPESAVTEVLVEDELVEEVSIDGMCGVY